MRGIRLAMNYLSKENGGNGGTIINMASLAGIICYGIRSRYSDRRTRATLPAHVENLTRLCTVAILQIIFDIGPIA